MPRIARELSAKAVERLKTPGLHPVGGALGLHLQVTPSAARSWVARLTVGMRPNAAGVMVQHRRDFGLGAFPAVTLAEARELAREYRKQLQTGTDPRAARLTARAKLEAQRVGLFTVTRAVQGFIEGMADKWAADPKGVSKREAMLKRYIAPHIGGMLLTDVGVSHVEKVLRPIWTDSPATAERVSSLLRNTFDWAKAKGYLKGDNPASSNVLSKVMPDLPKGGRQAALPFAKLPAFMQDLRGRDSITARALEVTILSALRTSESIGAQWSEIDLEEGVWTVPSSRMKIKGADHRVPLSEPLLAVLKRLHQESTSKWVFPGGKGEAPLSNAAMLELLKGMGPTDENGRRVTVHGFRSSFSTWASECTDHPAEVREMALAHRIKNEVEAAYRRGDLFDKRRALMADWSAFCCGKSAS